MSLDKNPLLNDNNQALCLNQVDFIRRFNDINRIMISAPDLYEAGKSESPEIIDSVQKDFNESWIVTSTRAHYEDNLEGTITHYFGSNVISPNEKRLNIPHYNGTSLNDVLGDEQGLTYLQVLFNTNDNQDNIKKTLKNLSNKTANETKIWTPNQDSRKSNPDRAVRFICNDVDFHVSASNRGGSDGRSRGVFENPAGVANENIVREKNEELKYPFDLNSGINRKSRCVYFSNTQNIGDFVKYAGLFCFNNNRFVVSLTAQESNNDYDKNIGRLLSKKASSREILNEFNEEFSPVYSHLLRYEQQNNNFILVDDLEAFGEPRIKELK